MTILLLQHGTEGPSIWTVVGANNRVAISSKIAGLQQLKPSQAIHLDVSDVRIGYIGYWAYSEEMFRKCKRIKILGIERNGMYWLRV